VPDRGDEDPPDPESDEEPPGHADGDPADPPERTDTDSDTDADPDLDAETAAESDEPAEAPEAPEAPEAVRSDDGTDADTDGAGSDEAGDDGELWSHISVPEGAPTGDGTADETTSEVTDAEGAEEAGDTEDTGDGSEIPDDYDPFEASADLDYGAHQYPSPADDEGEDGDDADDGVAESDPDAGEGKGDDETLDSGHVPDPEEVTEGWADDEAVPDAEAGEASAKSDGGYADGTDAASVGGYGGATDDEIFDAPPDDQEMPLADHIEEMVRRLGVVLVVMAIVSGIVFPFGERIINFLWYTVLVADPVPQPRVYHPLALVLARLKVATLAGFIVALPVFVYESYQFMKPGLYPHERRYYLASVPTSLVLATVGVLFAYFLVLPALFTYFLYYSDEVTIIAFGLTETFDLMVLMLGGFAFIFQIPLFVMLAIMMGLTTRQWMADRRLYFWGAFLGLAFLFSPDPTGMAPIIVAATMVALFEGTLFLLKWTNRGRRQVRGG